MGKFLGVLAGIIVIALVFMLVLGSCGAGLGFGPGGNGDGTGSGEDTSNTIADNNNTEETKESTTEATEASHNDANDTLIIAVSVVESDYFYNNKKISLDDLIDELKSIEEDFIVEVTDDNSALRAYNKLIDALAENNFDYSEK